MKNHWWGVQFEPDAVWEDGSPVVPPEPPTSADREDGTPGNQRMVTLDGEALARSLEFGSSDYRRSRTSHLFYSKRRPSFRWFDEKIRQLFQPDIRPQRLALTPAPGAAEGSVRLRRSAGAGRVRRVGAGGWETAG